MPEIESQSTNAISRAGEKVETTLHSFLYSTAQEPTTGVLQLVDKVCGTHTVEHTQFISKPHEAELNSADWFAQQAGNAFGMAADFWLLSKAHAVASPAVKAETLSLETGAIMKRAAIDGAVYNGIFHPADDPNKNFAWQRISNAATGAATFATLAGTVGLAKRFSASGELFEPSGKRIFRKTVGHNAVAGLIASVPAGIVNAESGSVLSGNGLTKDVGKSMYEFALGGTILGAVGTFAKPIDPAVVKVPEDVANPELLERIRDGKNANKTTAVATFAKPIDPTAVRFAKSVASRELLEGIRDGQDTKVMGSFRDKADADKTIVQDLNGISSPPPPPAQRPMTEARNTDVGTRPDPFEMFQQHHYKYVPLRSLSVDVRTAQGPYMSPSTDGQSRIVSDSAGKINHISFSPLATETEKANLFMAAAYARIAETDALAYDAARNSTLAGRLGLASKRSVMNQAVKGAADYISGGNTHSYGQYLAKRFGFWSPESQAWGQHIVTDPSSPESGWSPRVAPATESLFTAGIPISAQYRAAASNPYVMESAWSKGSAIRGVAAYADAQAGKMAGDGASPQVRDSLIGRLAPQISADEVAACSAIVQSANTVGEGEYAIRSEPVMVKSVAQLVNAGVASNATTAYAMLKTARATIATSAESQVGSTNFAAQTTHYAQQFLVDLKSAGLTETQMQDPRIVRLGVEAYGQDAQYLNCIPDTVRIMGPNASLKELRAIVEMERAGKLAAEISKADVEDRLIHSKNSGE